MRCYALRGGVWHLSDVYLSVLMGGLTLRHTTSIRGWEEQEDSAGKGTVRKEGERDGRFSRGGDTSVSGVFREFR
jgi:hypothetical protein